MAKSKFHSLNIIIIIIIVVLLFFSLTKFLYFHGSVHVLMHEVN